jgi:hypothetical protein
MTFTIKDLEKLGYSLQPDGSYANTANQPKLDTTPQAHPTRIRHPKPEQASPQTLDSHPESKTGSTGCPPVRSKHSTGKMSGTKGKKLIQGDYEPQHRIIITRYAPRCLDIDNYAGGCKSLIDCLKEANLIPDDDPASINVEFRQKKCRQTEQRTEIELFTLTPTSL